MARPPLGLANMAAQKADLMGHAKISMMKDVYVHRGELHADAAVYLDAAYAN